jgi:hypothetical protein
LLFLIKGISKPQQTRNAVFVMPPKKAAQLRPVTLPPNGVPVTPRATRSTLNLKPKTFDDIINPSESIDEPESIDQSEDARGPLQKLCPELMSMILEFALTSDEPVKISKHGRHQMPGILQVNSEIRAAGLKMYHSNNDFRAIVTGEHNSGPSKWAINIAADNLRHIPSFTIDYRLSALDYRQWYLRLHRTDEENVSNEDGLLRMCSAACSGIALTLMHFRLPRMGLDMTKVRLHVDLVPNDIPTRLRPDKRGLRTFLSRPIARLIHSMEKGVGRDINPIYTQVQDISTSIRRGRAMRGAYGCWDLVVT